MPRNDYLDNLIREEVKRRTPSVSTRQVEQSWREFRDLQAHRHIMDRTTCRRRNRWVAVSVAVFVLGAVVLATTGNDVSAWSSRLLQAISRPLGLGQQGVMRGGTSENANLGHVEGELTDVAGQIPIPFHLISTPWAKSQPKVQFDDMGDGQGLLALLYQDQKPVIILRQTYTTGSVAYGLGYDSNDKNVRNTRVSGVPAIILDDKAHLTKTLIWETDAMYFNLYVMDAISDGDLVRMAENLVPYNK